jgi:hypothetical protein
MIDLNTSGKPLNFQRPVVGRVVLEPRDRPEESVLVTNSVPYNLDAFKALITTARIEASEAPQELPIIHSARQISHLRTGDVVVLQPRSGHVRTLFRPDSQYNALLVTERCNSFCLMC